MKSTKPVLLFVALSLFANACLADADVFEAQVQGRAWTANRSFATSTSIAGKPAINLTGRIDAKTPSMISFNVIVSALDHCAGNYPLGGSPIGSTHGNFNANAGPDGNPMEDSYRFVDGAITIAVCDATTHAVSGSFSGHAKNSAGTVLTIEGGRFAQTVTASPAS